MMEESTLKFISKKSKLSSVPELIETYLVGVLEIHPEIESPIEKMFFLEWAFQDMFAIYYDDIRMIPQYKDYEITGKYYVDFMVIGFCNHPLIAIEIDGHDFHQKTKEQVRHDKERERFITKNVVKLLRFSGSEVYDNPTKAVNEIIELINKIEEEKE